MMRMFLGGILVGLVAFLMMLGVLMLGSRCSSTKVTVNSNLDPNPRVIYETTTWENVEVEGWH